MKITTQKQVEMVLAKATPYGLGNNLYLDVKGDNARAWLFIWKVRGRNEYAGLGSASGSKGHKVTLIEARRKADQYRSLISQGKDPRHEERRQGLTLTDAVETYVDRHRSQWRSAESARKWRHSIKVHAKDIADRPMASLVAADLRPVIDRYWHRDCGRELRFRLETLFRDNRSILGDDFRNPATREALGIGRRHKGKVKHHLAMPYESVPGFVAALDPAIDGHLPLKLLVLTATRTSEVVGARWPEFDLEQRLWTIPASRVKNGSDHHVPLTNEIVTTLASVRRKDGGERLFPSCQPHTMLDTLKRKIPGCAGYTVHGFRSAFRDWCGNETAFAREVVEETYGHEVGNDVERAYRRHKGLAKRRQVLEAWNRYVTATKVVPFPAPAKAA